MTLHFLIPEEPFLGVFFTFLYSLQFIIHAHVCTLVSFADQTLSWELESLVTLIYTTCAKHEGVWPVGLDKLCQHNFENKRYSQEYENNTGKIGKAFCVQSN